MTRIHIKGKFLYDGPQKFYIKGVTYGTFRPENDIMFPSAEVVKKDFSMMAEAGINCVRTYTAPPIYLLDTAQELGLRVMVGLPWEQNVSFLDDSSHKNDIIRRVREAAASCAKHPAILCYTIGNEIPAPIVRWYGKSKIEKFLKQLYKAVKQVDPEGLVTYVNYPTTEYLDLSFLDFDCFNVYLETPEKLSGYLARLHNLSGDRPLVLAEIGLDSMRNGEERQADVLEWQIQTVFAKGCAGIFIFAWTDEWWRFGYDIEDWDFGIVDRERQPKPALSAVAEAMKSAPLKVEDNWPFFSVVVCSYNGSATIRDTLEGLLAMDYPKFEIIVINDGSKDNLASIVKEYPVKLITTANRGLSNARNLGARNSKGDIVAYIDDDAYPDPHWLHYLAYAYTNSDHAGMGGPNIAPHEDGPIAHCVANSPGGPVHVLLSDEIAEHIPGCNMTFRRDVLLESGGFDPIYRSAGDDVDICWRIQEMGHTIGFHPSAMVWHHRRNSLKAYWRQQKGYGKAEALLEEKWPEKYNGFGHTTWHGRLYGNGFTLPIKWKKDQVFHGVWGSALFQSVYQRSESLWAYLPLMPEWYLLSGVMAIAGLLGIYWHPLLFAWIPLVVALAILVIQATVSATINVTLPAGKKNNPKYRLLIIFLHLMQPVARLYGRLNHGLTPWRRRGAGFEWKYLFAFKPKVFTYWSWYWRSSEDWLTDIEEQLIGLNLGVKRGDHFNRWDLQVSSGLFSRCRCLLTIEEHGGDKQFLRMKTWSVYSWSTLLTMLPSLSIALAAAMDERWVISGIFVFISLIILGRFFTDAATAFNSTRVAFEKLSEGAAKQKELRRIRVADLMLEYELHNLVPEGVHQTMTASKHKAEKTAADV